MLLIQKLEYYDHLTPNEQTVAHYLLDNQHRIQDISISEIAKETYTSLSTQYVFHKNAVTKDGKN